MKTVDTDDMMYFLKQMVSGEVCYMGVFADYGDTVKVAMMFDFHNVKRGEVAVVEKETITKRCMEGSCEIMSLEDFKKVSSSFQ